MLYIPSSSNEPPIGLLPFFYWVVGVLGVVPVLSCLFVRFLAFVGLFGDPRLFTEHAFDDAGGWIWLAVWQVGNLLWMASAYRLNAWEAERSTRRRSSAGRSPVVLRWRNRVLVSGRPGRLRRIVWFCLGSGNRIFLFPALTVGSLIVAHGFASMEEQPNSPGPQPLIGLFFVGVAVVFAARTVYRFWVRAQLMRTGRLVTATVLDAGSEGSRWRIDYQLLTPVGQPQAGSEYLGYRPRRMHSPGDQLTILYHEKIAPQVM